MTLYSENLVNFPENGLISLHVVWHPIESLLAISSFSQEKGGFVTIFDELGEPLKDITYPVHRSFQVTALTWHPQRTILATGWENGEFKIWSGEEFVTIGAPHKSPITLLVFSEKGTRLASADSTGCLVGWKLDATGPPIVAFQLDLKDSITHVTFRLTTVKHHDLDGLKAGVSNDEIDVLNTWRPKTTARKMKFHEGTGDNCTFYVGTQTGSIHYVDALGSSTEVLNTEGTALNYVVHHPVKDSLIVMMEGLTVGHFAIDSRGNLNEIAKVKLSGRVQTRGLGNQGLVWASNSSLAILTGELIVRIWDIDTNDNYVLPTTLKLYLNEERNRNFNEVFTCIAYSHFNQTLCAGTNVGRIYFWTRNLTKLDNPEECWELNNVNSVSGTVKQLAWGSFQLRLPLLSVNCVTSVYIMKEQSICTTYCEQIWATQKSSTQILLENATSNFLLQLDSQVTDMCISEEYFVFTNGRAITVYEIKFEDDDTFELNSTLSKEYAEGKPEFSTKFLHKFTCDNERLLIHKKTIVVLTTREILLKTLSGTTLNTINFSSTEGEPIGVDICASFVTVFTIEGFVKVYELSEREPKLVTLGKNLADSCPDFGEVIQAKANCTGSKIAMTLAAANLIPDGRLYVWDVETDALLSYDFHKYGDYSLNDDYTEKTETLQLQDEQEKLNSGFDDICANRVPLSLFWDPEDPRLLVCDAKKVKIAGDKSTHLLLMTRSKSDTTPSLKDEDHVILTMFVSTGIKIHDIKPTDSESRLLALSTPYIVILEKLIVLREVMSDFVGLETCTKATRAAVLNFSYNLSMGNMDEAFRAIKLVENAGVWASLARMCVKTRRLDVAGVCLGHMGNARAAMALRIAMGDRNLPHEAKVAVLAVHLGMLDEAEQLYIQCERYDLLSKLLRSRNKLDAARAIAESKDRIHLKNTDYSWARSLENIGDFKEAAIRYEKANTHKFDVPRMLLDHPDQLETYMSKTKDPDLLKWWGQYVESQGEMQAALRIYKSAGDVYSQVRVLCFLGEESKAAELARVAGNDKAAFYHMARFYETTGNHEEAVSFFTRANAYSNAVRLCKEKHMDDELWNIGSIAGNRERVECARYFEDSAIYDRAVMLYHRAGMLHKALDLAFRTQQFDILQQITADLDTESDPALVEKCATYFIDNEQFDKAVDLLAMANKYKRAIDVCLEHNVQLTEDLVEKLTPEKEELEETVRLDVLEKLAESCMLQGSYHLATKKFTQAGDKIRAMKALLKSGDTEKIIFFAGVSRQREIYIMAANYLQSLDWQNDPDILKNIVTFYSKGKALDLLANFYVACAQVEVDEFKNYEKAHAALSEAAKCLEKISSPKDVLQHQRAIEIVQQRIGHVKKFIDIRKLFDRGDVQAGLTQSRQLLMLGGRDMEAAVRKGDIYGLMIQELVKQGDFSEAKQLFLELKQLLVTEEIPITYYVNADLVGILAQGLGVPSASLAPSRSTLSIDDKEEEEEELEDVIEDDVDS